MLVGRKLMATHHKMFLSLENMLDRQTRKLATSGRLASWVELVQFTRSEFRVIKEDMETTDLEKLMFLFLALTVLIHYVDKFQMELNQEGFGMMLNVLTHSHMVTVLGLLTLKELPILL